MTWRPDGSWQLCLALREPESMARLGGAEWTQVLAAARETSLLGPLWVRAQDTGVAGEVPEPVARHLRAACVAADRNAEAIRWELDQLQSGLLQRLEPPVALKGAAYLLAGLPNARGRLCNDIDLLFPRSQVERAESLLFFEGWSGGHHDAHDERYYREWMHELPPLQHRRRGTTLDLHHNILPETFAVRTDAERLLRASWSLDAPWRYRILCPEHMVLHAVVHLFAETDWDRGLRDLYDVHVLLEHYGAGDEAFLGRLRDEAQGLGVTWLLAHAVACCRRLLATPLPEAYQRELDVLGDRRGYGLARVVFRHGLKTRSSTSPARDAAARGVLFLRGHWLKMPLRLLVPHLWHKSWAAWKKDSTHDDAETGAANHG